MYKFKDYLLKKVKGGTIRIMISVGILLPVITIITILSVDAQTPKSRGNPATSSYMPVDIKESFASIMSRMTAAKLGIEKAHINLLNERYELSNRPAQGVTMSRGKPLQEDVRVKLPPGMTWEKLAAMSPDEIR